ncbi:hypothetical protein C0991_009373, partial [Blastosporella zonata]
MSHARRSQKLSHWLADPDNIGDIKLQSHQARREELKAEQSRKELSDKNAGALDPLTPATLKWTLATAELDVGGLDVLQNLFRKKQRNIQVGAVGIVKGGEPENETNRF